MRIVGGSLRGHRLAVPKSQNIRPTTDRVRESLFNILDHSYGEFLENARVLDVFAGTGALGIEALSRGAEHVSFIELGDEALKLLRQNVAAVKISSSTQILKRDAIRPGSCGLIAPFGLVFLDPPYGKSLGEAALNALRTNTWLANNALVVLEEDSSSLPNAIEGFTFLERRDFGGTSIGLFHHTVS